MGFSVGNEPHVSQRVVLDVFAFFQTGLGCGVPELTLVHTHSVWPMSLDEVELQGATVGEP